MSSTIAINTTDRAIRERIEQVVTLESCRGNQAERELKIAYLMQIKDPEILEYLLTIAIPDYNNYVETGEHRMRLKDDPILKTVICFEDLWFRYCNMLEQEGYRNSSTSEAGILWWILNQFSIKGEHY
jgi:hypothetical protein